MTVDVSTPPFIKEICQYLADNSGGRFTFGSGASNNLKLGELVRGVEGVYAIESASEPPDMYTPIVTYTVDFWAINSNARTAHEDLEYIFQLFHQNDNITTPSFYSYFAYAPNVILDMDRDGESRKMFKLTIVFICRDTLIS